MPYIYAHTKGWPSPIQPANIYLIKTYGRFRAGIIACENVDYVLLCLAIRSYASMSNTFFFHNVSILIYLSTLPVAVTIHILLLPIDVFLCNYVTARALSTDGPVRTGSSATAISSTALGNILLLLLPCCYAAARQNSSWVGPYCWQAPRKGSWHIPARPQKLVVGNDDAILVGIEWIPPDLGAEVVVLPLPALLRTWFRPKQVHITSPSTPCRI